MKKIKIKGDKWNAKTASLRRILLNMLRGYSNCQKILRLKVGKIAATPLILVV